MLYDWFEHINFLHPWVLLLLVIIPVLAIWHWRNSLKRQATMMVTTTHFIGDVKSYVTWFRHVPLILRSLALFCLIVALARPQQRFTENETEGEGIDIMLCFDISGSMTEKDFIPNRLEASKDVAKDFVQGRQGDRMGVVIFSRQSFTLCPLTTDINTVIAQINNISSGYLEDEGTAIGSGIATSVDRLKDSKVKSKIIILLTDGVDFGGTIPPDIAKEMAKLYRVKIYAIGVGSAKEIMEEESTSFGKVRNPKKLEFNEALLKNLASETGGQYFHATDKEALLKIYASINQLERSKIQMTSFNRYTEEFLPWVLVALAFLLIEMILRYTLFKKFP